MVSASNHKISSFTRYSLIHLFTCSEFTLEFPSSGRNISLHRPTIVFRDMQVIDGIYTKTHQYIPGESQVPIFHQSCRDAPSVRLSERIQLCTSSVQSATKHCQLSRSREWYGRTPLRIERTDGSRSYVPGPLLRECIKSS